MNGEDEIRDRAGATNYFDPEAPIANLKGDLPHWRQAGTMYFVTFRLADALPQEKLQQFREEMAGWLKVHPEPHDEITRREFYERFPARIQGWLDAGYGSCLLSVPEVRRIVEGALCHFDHNRYTLDEFTVAGNHVHVLITPREAHSLSDILHSWKSFTAHEILKIEAAVRRLREAQQRRHAAGYRTMPQVAADSRRCVEETKAGTALPRGPSALRVWQKESFDNIVRSPESLEKFRRYIRAHEK